MPKRCPKDAQKPKSNQKMPRRCPKRVSWYHTNNTTKSNSEMPKRCLDAYLQLHNIFPGPQASLLFKNDRWLPVVLRRPAGKYWRRWRLLHCRRIFETLWRIFRDVNQTLANIAKDREILPNNSCLRREAYASPERSPNDDGKSPVSCCGKFPLSSDDATASMAPWCRHH